MDKPIAEACFRNQEAIGDALMPYLHDKSVSVLELGSGTGQHAVYLANRFPKLDWLPSDLPECLPGIEAWRSEATNSNMHPPVIVDAEQFAGFDKRYDATFTANTIHFVSEQTGLEFLSILAQSTRKGGYCFIYGPFKDNGRYHSEGDKRLDLWLQARDPSSGIRDRQWVIEQSSHHGLVLSEIIDMPANNFILVFCQCEQREET